MGMKPRRQPTTAKRATGRNGAKRKSVTEWRLELYGKQGNDLTARLAQNRENLLMGLFDWQMQLDGATESIQLIRAALGGGVPSHHIRVKASGDDVRFYTNNEQCAKALNRLVKAEILLRRTVAVTR